MKRLLAFIIFACALPALGQSWSVGGGNVLAGSNYVYTICPQASIASYLTMRNCVQPPSFDRFDSYYCTSVPSSICTNLGVNGANINMLLDPNGGHTFLFAAVGAAWNLTAGQTVYIRITGKVWGATKNDTWPHFDFLGQTNDGFEYNTVTVFCGPNCTDGRSGTSFIPCDAAHNAGIECNDQATDVYITPYGAQFLAAPPQAPYVMTIELNMSGGTTGTATIKSMGMHLL